MTDRQLTAGPLLIKDAKMLFKNFTGLGKPLNSEGDRNFNVVIDPQLAPKLIEDGWRVKKLKDRQDGDDVIEGDYVLKVKVNYGKGRPPRCVVITSQNRVDWGADEIGALDVADIKKVDVLINGWWSDMAGGGYGGYLKTIFVWLNEDELELEYADLLPGSSSEHDEELQDA